MMCVRPSQSKVLSDELQAMLKQHSQLPHVSLFDFPAPDDEGEESQSKFLCRPITPSADEVLKHEATHYPYRSTSSIERRRYSFPCKDLALTSGEYWLKLRAPNACPEGPSKWTARRSLVPKRPLDNACKHNATIQV